MFRTWVYEIAKNKLLMFTCMSYSKIPECCQTHVMITVMISLILGRDFEAEIPLGQ